MRSVEPTYTGAVVQNKSGWWTYRVYKKGKFYIGAEEFKPVKNGQTSKGMAQESLRDFLKHLNNPMVML